jgi:hypothetical protein
MVVGLGAFVAKVDVAGVARIARKLVTVNVAAPTDGHAGAQDVGTALDIHVAAHAVTVNARKMAQVGKPQLLAGPHGALTSAG